MKPSRIFILALLGVFVWLQYKLWLSAEGAPHFFQLKHQITQMNKENSELQTRNAQIAAEVENLKQGNEAIEEHARNDLGLIKADEIFYQIVP